MTCTLGTNASVGIVAAKLVQQYGLPTVVIGFDGDIGRGSARIPTGSPVNLFEALRAAEPHLDRFGGHAAAAGLTIRKDRLDAFRATFEDAIARQLDGGAAASGPLQADAEVALGEIDERLAEELSRLGPFGMGNPEPVLLARDVSVERSRVVGERHLQITLRQGLHARDGIAFNLADANPGAGARVQAAFVPEVDTFRGARRLRLRLHHLSNAR